VPEIDSSWKSYTCFSADYLKISLEYHFVSDIAVFVLKRGVKLQLTNFRIPLKLVSWFIIETSVELPSPGELKAKCILPLVCLSVMKIDET